MHHQARPIDAAEETWVEEHIDLVDEQDAMNSRHREIIGSELLALQRGEHLLANLAVLLRHEALA